MDKIILIKHVEAGCSVRGIAKLEGCSYSNVRYWMKKHEVKPANSNNNISRKGQPCVCKLCSREYTFSRERGHSLELCNTCKQRRFRHNFKKKLVDHFGGKCIKCSYNKCIAALEFHHRDPEEKEFDLSQGTKKFDEFVKEAEKCDLLCANCHAEEHFRDLDTPIAESA